jgi:hypothetical protein
MVPPEETSEERKQLPAQLLRLGFAFLLLFAGVFFAFWWSGRAVEFGAARVADKSVPTYRVWGVVRDAATHEPIPWVSIEDDPGGLPPFYRTNADMHGAYELLTLAVHHRVRVSANGYKTATNDIGRQWFIWMPRGEEHLDLELTRE